MRQASGESRNRGMAMLPGLLLLLLLLVSGAARAAPDYAAWAFDLLARVEQWRPTGPLDFLSGVANGQPIPAAAQARIQAGYGRLPMHFEPNIGQTAEEVKFVARGPGYTLFLTADEAVLALRPSRPTLDRHDPRHLRQPFDLAAMTHDAAPAIPGAVIRTRLEGATRNPEPQPEGVEKLPGISNYFLGNDPAKWRTHIPHYQRVRYPNVYPGIDLVYYGNPQRLEHDFIVAPGADPTAIQLAISGAEQARVNAEGDLVLKVPGGEVVQQAPKIYQVINGQQQAVAGRYVLREPAQGAESLATQTISIAVAKPKAVPQLVGFEVVQYDQKHPLIIDPALVYATYLGGNDTGFFGDVGGEIAVDSQGNAYVTGLTSSPDFPKVNAKYPNLWGQQDAFVFKLSANGQQVIYSTYLGGSNWDVGTSITVDKNGNAYVTGETLSTDFPKVNALYPNLWGTSDAFIFKLSANGQQVFYSTYLGGNGTEMGHGIGVDNSGNAYVTGYTTSKDFPTKNAIYQNLRGSSDTFVFKLSADGQQVMYSTYFGGSGQEGFSSYSPGDHHLLAVDSAGNVYVTGTTFSSDFPTVNALYPNLRGGGDAYIFKLSADGQRVVYSTYLGGSQYEYGRGIAVDSSGNAYITGITSSSDFPKINPLYRNLGGVNDAFVFKLSADGQQAIFSTYLGGSADDYGGGIAVDENGNAYVTGMTRSTNFQMVNARYPNFWGEEDAFIAKIADSSPSLYPDLSISESDIVPIQAVKDVDINGDGRLDLVLNRPTLIRAQVHISNPERLTPSQPITVQLTFQGTTLTKDLTVSDLQAGPAEFFLTPQSSGDASISVMIDPESMISETDKSNNQASKPVSIKPVRDIRLAYMRVDYLDQTPNFAKTVTNSSDYLQAVYPVAPNHFFNVQLSQSFLPALSGYLPNDAGAIDDAINLWLEGKLNTITSLAERIVGIVPKLWFTYHQQGDHTAGICYPMVQEAVFVLDNSPLVTAHELGHSYGFMFEGYELEPDGTCCKSYGSPTSGYWVQRQRAVEDSIDYMGTSPGAVSYPDEATKRWSTTDNFIRLFRQFRTEPNDPEVLLVTGMIDQMGTVTLGPMYRVPEGTVSQSTAGDASVRVLDASGNTVLAEIPFEVDFRVFTDPPMTLTTAPFAFAVPYPGNAAQVHIVVSGQVVARALVTPKLLHDAVASMPDVGFVRNASQSRNALLNKIDALDKQLAAGDITGARNKLENDIREHLVEWLVDYPTQTARQYTKAAILELVDELLQRLEG